MSVAAVAGVLIGAGTASAAPPAGVGVRLVADGQCAFPSTFAPVENGRVVVQEVVGWGGCGVASDVWQLDDAGGGLFRLAHPATGLCASAGTVFVFRDLRGTTTETVGLGPCGSGVDVWSVDDAGDGRFRLALPATGQCARRGVLAAPGFGTRTSLADVVTRGGCGSGGDVWGIDLA